tara:strand:+ start:548 stop:1018 length:471 start_codon:yes stop_codon:yes gene_type:complete
MNYLKELLSSTITTTKDNFKDFKITDSGLYILHPNFDLESISGEKYLKVGMTVELEGLKGRLGTHFSNNEGSTVLGRHLSLDISFEEKFGFDFSEKEERREFLRQYSFFQVLPLKEFNWKNKDELKIKRKQLKSIETIIENNLRDKIRYIDEVKVR